VVRSITNLPRECRWSGSAILRNALRSASPEMGRYPNRLSLNLFADHLDISYRPERGSFPLDHEGEFESRSSTSSTTRQLVPYTSSHHAKDGPWLTYHSIDIGECKHIISGYLKCIKSNRGTNDEACRKLAKEYLTCRMDKYVASNSKLWRREKQTSWARYCYREQSR
jgi:hypothetical protein